MHRRNGPGSVQSVVMCTGKPDQTFKSGNDEIDLYLHNALVNGSRADCMVVRYGTSETQEVLVFRVDDRRKVMRKTKAIQLETNPASGQAGVAELSENEEKRFLALYDLLKKRTYS